MPFGTGLNEAYHIDVCCMDCASLHDDILVCGGKDSISLYRISKDDEPKFISSLGKLGETRQIKVSGKLAYVSTRADGVFICDLGDIRFPKIAYHIDTLELATGIDVLGGILAVTNRHLGCELFDVRDPYLPVRLGDFLCGEAQSVKLYRNLAIIGDWINHQVRIFDISDAAEYREISRFSIDGFADGISIIENSGRSVCIAAGGHHSARFRNRRKYANYTYFVPEMITDGFGCGHGIELFDITDPRYPEFLSQLKTPPLFGGPDTWRVYSDGTSCVFTDSVNGFFVIDISDPFHPSFKSHFKLPCKNSPASAHISIQPYSGAITGAAWVNGFLCAASPTDGISIFNADVGRFTEFSDDYLTDKAFTVSKHIVKNTFYISDAQLHSFCEYGGNIYCACGDSGIEVLDKNGNLIYTHKTESICHDICVYGNYIISAEGQLGAACYRVIDGKLSLTDRISFGSGKSVREAVVIDNYILLELGCSSAVKLMLDDEMKFVSCGAPFGVGLLYHRHLSRSRAGKYIAAFMISPGPVLIDCLSEHPAVLKGSAVTACCPIHDGVCGYGEKLILISDGKYTCLDNPLDCMNMNNCRFINIDGAFLKGMPFVCGDKLLILDRCSGTVELLDISEPHVPCFIKRIETGSHPEFAAVVDGRILVACGHGGITEIDA